MKRVVIHTSAFPIRMPVATTAITYLLLDRWAAPGWVWGVVGTLVLMLWLGALLIRWNEEPKRLNGYGGET
jgi:hypothetical protein